MYQDELKHFGVPGMKWGVRKIKAINNRINKSYDRAADKIIKRAESVDVNASRSFFKKLRDNFAIERASNITRERRTDYKGVGAKSANKAGKAWNNMTPGERLRRIKGGREAAGHLLALLAGGALLGPVGAGIADRGVRKVREDSYKNRIDYGKNFVNEYRNKNR